MAKNKEQYETISIDLNPELFRLINQKTKDIDQDETSLLLSCIQTGLRLSEINTIFRKKSIEESAFQKQLVEAYGDRSRSVANVSKDLERIREADEEKVIKNKANKQSSSLSKKDFKTLKVRVDSDLYQDIKDVSDKLGVEITTFVRYCLRTGLYLEDLNLYLQKREKEER